VPVRLKTLSLLSVLAACGGTLALSANSASADTTSNLSISSFHQILADTSAGYLFFSEGALSDSLLTEPNTTSPLVITNLSGATIATVDPDGVEGLALSPDGATLYAALAGNDEIAAINIASIASDPAAPTQTLYPLASGDVPYSVAVQSGKVWVSYNPETNDAAGSSAIGDINLSASSPATAFEPATAGPSNWYSAPDLAADPSDSGTLVATQPDISSANAATFNTTTDPATPISSGSIGSSSSSTACSFAIQVAVLPGGKQFAAACPSPHNVEVYNATDVTTAVSQYVNTAQSFDGSGTEAVAIAPDGTLASGAQGTAGLGLAGGTPTADYVYSPAGGKGLRNVLSLGTATMEYAESGLAWAADGSKLFAVLNVQVGSGWQYELQTFTAPETTKASVTLNVPSSVRLGKTVSVSGTLALSTGYPPSGTPVTVTRTMAGSTTETKTLTTGTNGAFSFTDAAPPTYGTYTYTASYAGNATTGTATTTSSVTVTRLPTTLTLATNGTNYSYGSKVTATAHLGTTYTGRTVTIYEEPYGGGAEKTLVTGKVNSSGNLTATYTPTTSTTFGASFSGDAKYAPVTTTHNVYVYAGVWLKITGYYTTAKHGSTTYKVFHHTARLTAAVTVGPNKKGECVQVEVQDYYSGGWHANLTTGCGTLNSSSQISGYFTLTNATGGLFRIRADYVRSSSDKKNLGSDSSWSYFSVVK
jgi:hypothetical protein